ncbi:MAG: hypothetical protein ACLP3K_14905 [Candidatus Acidiferrales bacterium]
MPVKEASFWVFLAMFSTGLYFIFERLDRLRMFGAILLIIVGAVGMALLVIRHHYPNLNLPSNGNWVWIAMAITWVLLGYAIYSDHYPKIVVTTVEKPVDRVVEKTIPCPEPLEPVRIKTPEPKVPVVQAPKATQQSSGDCSPNQIGVNNTNNCVLPPRTLSDEQRANMVQYLSSTKYKLAIGSLIGDEEAGEFAAALADTFERSGWTVDNFIGRQMQSGLSAEAVTVSLYAPPGSTSSNNKEAQMVVNALRNAGIKVAVNLDSTLPPDAVNLYVGARRRDKP